MIWCCMFGGNGLEGSSREVERTWHSIFLIFGGALYLFFEHDRPHTRAHLSTSSYSNSYIQTHRMIVRLSKLVVLFALGVGLSESSRTSLRSNHQMTEEATTNLESPVGPADKKGGLRKLDDTCWHGGQEGDDLTFLVRDCI